MMKPDHRNTCPQRPLGALAVVAMFTIVVVAACARAPAETLGAPPMQPATPGGTATEAPPETQAPAGETVIVDSIAFQTNELTVPVGSTVTWDNQDAVAHTVTHGTNGSPADSPLFDMQHSVGEQVSYTFEQAGTVPVTCTIHPQMQMSVTVE